MRVPWGEGNGDGGVSARGSCQGGGCTAPRPCPGFPLSRERRWGRWREGFGQGGGCTAPRPCPGFPLSRERRWGSWREGFVSGWGNRPAPLPWIPAFAGTTMGALARGVRVRVGDAPPRAPALDSRFAGTTMGALARGSSFRIPPRAPALDSRFRGNDDGGVGARGSRVGGCTAGFGSAPAVAFAGSGDGKAASGRAFRAQGMKAPWRSPSGGGLRARDLGSGRHAMGFERPSGLWHHCQGSVVGVWGISTLYAREGGGRATAS